MTYQDDPAFHERHARQDGDPSPKQIRRMARAIRRAKPREPQGPTWRAEFPVIDARLLGLE